MRFCTGCCSCICLVFFFFPHWKSGAKAIKGRLENVGTVCTVKVFCLISSSVNRGGVECYIQQGNTDNSVFSLKYELEVGERVDGAQRGQYKFWKSDLEMCVLYIFLGGSALFIVQGLK